MRPQSNAELKRRTAGPTSGPPLSRTKEPLTLRCPPPAPRRRDDPPHGIMGLGVCPRLQVPECRARLRPPAPLSRAVGRFCSFVFLLNWEGGVDGSLESLWVVVGFCLFHNRMCSPAGFELVAFLLPLFKITGARHYSLVYPELACLETSPLIFDPENHLPLGSSIINKPLPLKIILTARCGGGAQL